MVSKKTAPSPLCICISVMFDSPFISSYLHFRWPRKTRKEAEYIFIYQHCCSSSLYTTYCYYLYIFSLFQCCYVFLLNPNYRIIELYLSMATNLGERKLYSNQLFSTSKVDLDDEEYDVGNGPGALCSIPGRFIPKTLKMVLDTSLLNTQQYKVRIKGKVEQSRKRSSAPPTPRFSSYWKRSLLVALYNSLQLYFITYYDEEEYNEGFDDDKG